jgi:hypothetical protein
MRRVVLCVDVRSVLGVYQESSRDLLLARIKSSPQFAAFLKEVQRNEQARNLDLEVRLCACRYVGW